jgi:hypothetical protein
MDLNTSYVANVRNSWKGYLGSQGGYRIGAFSRLIFLVVGVDIGALGKVLAPKYGILESYLAYSIYFLPI